MGRFLHENGLIHGGKNGEIPIMRITCAISCQITQQDNVFPSGRQDVMSESFQTDVQDELGKSGSGKDYNGCSGMFAMHLTNSLWCLLL